MIFCSSSPSLGPQLGLNRKNWVSLTPAMVEGGSGEGHILPGWEEYLVYLEYLVEARPGGPGWYLVYLEYLVEAWSGGPGWEEYLASRLLWPPPAGRPQREDDM